MITRKQIEIFLNSKKGYLKKSSLEIAKQLWKNSPKLDLPKTNQEVQKEIQLISQVKSELRKKTNEIKSSLLTSYEELMEFLSKPKRKLFFDIEVSPNILMAWRVGNNINLSHESIVKERAIICVCYKWNDEKEVHSIEWNNGCDKELVKKFAKIMNSADIVIGQNSDRFDIKWFRTRCLKHSVPLKAKFNSIDTLKMAKAGFYFNSNKLDYMGQFMGLGGKIKVAPDLWKDITLNNDTLAMKKMVDYCKQDVILLEEVYNKLQEYTPIKNLDTIYKKSPKGDFLLNNVSC